MRSFRENKKRKEQRNNIQHSELESEAGQRRMRNVYKPR